MKNVLRVDSLLAISALGVVFGDIGTSPLYAMHALFSHAVIPRSAEAITGIISLVLWALLTVVSIKCIIVLLSVDNDGDGGIMALSALVMRSVKQGVPKFAIVAGIVGAGLFYGDGLITPAISVMSATEGLAGLSPSLEYWAVPFSILIVLGLFSVQHFGTGKVGALFGPTMLVWFLVLALLGLPQIATHPGILLALLPHTGLLFIINYPLAAFIALGTIVLVVTGAEALYADMGHFGPNPIRVAWFAIAFPCLALNYLGQGAFLLANPTVTGNPFFAMGPSWSTLPLGLLAACAAVVASQSVISGVFSLTRQAERLGCLPYVRAVQTSARARGQIYLPPVNALLCIGVIALIVFFQSSTALAGAYGLAVTSTFLLTSVLLVAYMRAVRRWNRVQVVSFIMTVDAAETIFFVSGLTKIVSGGWIPPTISVAMCAVMVTWRKGRSLLSTQHQQFIDDRDHFLRTPGLTVVPGTAIYQHVDHRTTPSALLTSAMAFGAIHDRIIAVSIVTMPVPHVHVMKRYTVHSTFRTMYPLRYENVTIRFGFKDDINIPAALEEAVAQGLMPQIKNPLYITTEAHFPPENPGVLPRWQRALFLTLYRISSRPTSRFRLPADRSLVIGLNARM